MCKLVGPCYTFEHPALILQTQCITDYTYFQFSFQAKTIFINDLGSA